MTPPPAGIPAPLWLYSATVRPDWIVYHDEEEYLAAANEVLLLQVDSQPRVSPMPAEQRARTETVVIAHRALPWPPLAGRQIAHLLKPDSNL